MNEPLLRLSSAPIVEAVLDIDCDMSPTMDIAALESQARDVFRDQYPKMHTQLVQEHRIKQEGRALPEMSVRQGIQAFRFLQDDEKQLVQVRAEGFSFNRLAPYSSLDDYLVEVERTWRLFVGLASPVQIRLIRLRYINRILLPLLNGRVDLDDYLKLGPRLPDEERLTFAGFLNQHSALEADTGNQVNIVLTTQLPDKDLLPIIFDIEASNAGKGETSDWPWILTRIQSLRNLKNRIFRNTLTEQCWKLYQR